MKSLNKPEASGFLLQQHFSLHFIITFSYVSSSLQYMWQGSSPSQLELIWQLSISRAGSRTCSARPCHVWSITPFLPLKITYDFDFSHARVCFWRREGVALLLQVFLLAFLCVNLTNAFTHHLLYLCFWARGEKWSWLEWLSSLPSKRMHSKALV